MTLRKSVDSSRTAVPTPAPALALLGDARATIIRTLVETGGSTAPSLADVLGISAVAVRKHLATLEGDGYVTCATVHNGGRGRPAAQYRLTDKARRDLLPSRSAGLANDTLDFLAETQGRSGVLAFHRWRREREATEFEAVVTAEDLHARLRQLVGALEHEGYEATVARDGDGYTLTQTHCAIYDIARDHPEMCAHEAAVFRRVLGADVSRRETLAKGDSACVCSVRQTPLPAPTQPSARLKAATR